MGRSSPRRDLLAVALGQAPADVYIRGGNLVNVLTGEIYPADIAIQGTRIAAVGDVGYALGSKTTVIEARGHYLTPGLVDAHVHEYHTYLGVDEYSRLMLSHGVTTLADDLYGQGIVGGTPAIKFFKEALEASGLRLIFLVPTIAYLQNRAIGLTPTPGVTARDLFEMLDWDGCRGLSETPFPPIIDKSPEFLDLFEAALERGKVVTGHAADIEPRQLQAYIAMGAYTDHESVEHHDGLAKARLGMKVLMRNGSMEHNVPELARILTEHSIDARTTAFSTDVASAEKLAGSGAIDEHIRLAVAQGVPPITAVQMATLNAAEIFNVHGEVGSLAPGRFADVLIVRNLVSFDIDSVLVGGQLAVQNSEFLLQRERTRYPKAFYQTVKLTTKLAPEDLVVKAPDDNEVEVRVIGVADGQIVTAERHIRMQPVGRRLMADPAIDVLLLAMVDRHQKGTGIGIGFVQGFGLKAGALASSVSTETANLCAVGANPEDMALAMNHIVEIGGGMVVAKDGRLVAVIELPILGLISEDPLQVVIDKFAAALAAAAELGCVISSPFSQLEFCFAGGLDGELKLSDEGLMQVKDGLVKRVSVIV